ncbi:MAG: M23 family metallopeptidase, partial [Thermoleophilaceae bacterium]|nr:M23 family metallopeptidase [Thermoleophilaceae bacterium]
MCRLLALLALAVLLGGWTWPVEGEVLNRYRNGADPYARGMHRGIDVAARPGTPVVAASGGLVRFAGVAGSSGLTVSMRTLRFDTAYLHLSGVSVRPGTRVREGARIG